MQQVIIVVLINLLKEIKIRYFLFQLTTVLRKQTRTVLQSSDRQTDILYYRQIHCTTDRYTVLQTDMQYIQTDTLYYRQIHCTTDRHAVHTDRYTVLQTDTLYYRQTCSTYRQILCTTDSHTVLQTDMQYIQTDTLYYRQLHCTTDRHVVHTDRHMKGRKNKETTKGNARL